jgi:hypothetical protein
MAIELSNRHNMQDNNDNSAAVSGTPASGNTRGSDDDDDGSSDTSSILTELGADEFLPHFRERDGRLFHSHGDLPYPLPVDGKEQVVCPFLHSQFSELTALVQRLNAQHKILCDLLGSHYVGPVAEALAYERGRQKRVLDLCTGTGIWYVISSRPTLIHLIHMLWLCLIG